MLSLNPGTILVAKFIMEVKQHLLLHLHPTKHSPAQSHRLLTRAGKEQPRI